MNFIKSLLQAVANKALAEQVDKELKAADPELEEAKAALDENTTESNKNSSTKDNTKDSQ